MAISRIVFDRDDHLDLDRSVARQLRDADGASGVAAGFTKQIDQQMGGGIDDFRLPVEARRGGDKACDLEDALDATESTERRLQAGQPLEDANARCLSSLLHRYLRPHLADAAHLAIDLWKLAAHIGGAAVDGHRYVMECGLRRLW